MVRIRDKKYGKITNVEKRYADVLVKLGKHSLVAEPSSESVLKQAKQYIEDGMAREYAAAREADFLSAVQTPESKATPPRTVEAAFDRPRPVPAMGTRAMKPVQPEDEDEVEISERTGKPKRSYTRRDMVAED